MRVIYLFGVIYLFLCSIYAQENTTIDELLHEAESVLYTRPTEAIKILEYALSITKEMEKTSQANFLLAQAYYMTGQFNEATNFALDARNQSDKIKNIKLKLNTQLFTISLLRELGFKYLADIYISDIITYKKSLNTELTLDLTAKLNQDQAAQNIRIGDYVSAKENLFQALKTYQKQRDTLSMNTVNLKLSDIFLATEEIDSASFYIEKTLENLRSGTPNYFQKEIALCQLGQISFLKKDFTKAKQLFQEAYSLSEELPNIHYKNLSLQGLMTSYLALEETEAYSKLMIEQNQSSAEMVTDRTRAMNSVYNRIDNFEENNSKNLIKSQTSKIYKLSIALLLLIIIGLLYNYYLNIKSAQYNALLKYITPSNPEIEVSAVRKSFEKSSIVPEEIEIQLLEKLKRFEKGTKYTQPDMSIALLASMFDTNTKYLSEVINRQKGKNFNAYINELRINYIIEKLRTEKIYSQYKISYLAEESGFSSHSSFATVFKSITGVSPTAFMDLLKKQTV